MNARFMNYFPLILVSLLCPLQKERKHTPKEASIFMAFSNQQPILGARRDPCGHGRDGGWLMVFLAQAICGVCVQVHSVRDFSLCCL